MKTHAAFIIGATVALLVAGSARAAEPAKGFDAFRFVQTRNIFDPDRRAAPGSAPAPERAAPTAARANFIALTGTMVAEGKMLAFFSGSRSEYSKVISVGDTIADFKITGITNAQVELDRGGKPVVVAVGKQIPLEGSAAAIAVPDVAAPPPDAPGAQGPPAEASAPTDAKPATPTDDKNEILRRMMERREKELSK